MKEDDLTMQPRRRLLRAERHRQLLDVAWAMVHQDGTDALSLGRVAAQAGVAKPVVYDHFATRAGLLAALYLDYDARQNALMDAALSTCEPDLSSTAQVIASSYVECVLRQGHEIPGVISALAGSPELGTVKAEYEKPLMEKCRRALLPYAGKGGIRPPALRAMVGAAEALSNAAATGELTAKQAKEELSALIVALVARGSPR